MTGGFYPGAEGRTRLLRTYSAIPAHHTYYFIRRIGHRSRLVHPSPRLDAIKTFPAVLNSVRLYWKHLDERSVLIGREHRIEVDAAPLPAVPRVDRQLSHQIYVKGGSSGRPFAVRSQERCIVVDDARVEPRPCRKCVTHSVEAVADHDDG